MDEMEFVSDFADDMIGEVEAELCEFPSGDEKPYYCLVPTMNNNTAFFLPRCRHCDAIPTMNEFDFKFSFDCKDHPREQPVYVSTVKEAVGRWFMYNSNIPQLSGPDKGKVV